MKKPFLLLVLFCSVVCVNAQTGQLTIKGSNKNHYLDHTVAPKEGLFAIGRLYNIHPRHIAAYNNIDMNAGLAIGQIIHIPLTDTNFTQKTKKGTAVYYTVGESEGLLKVSNTNNNVPMQKLREWNGLKSDNIAAGSKLIVGYLISPEMLARGPVKELAPVNAEKETVKAETIKENTGKSVTSESKPAITPEKTVAKNEQEEKKAVKDVAVKEQQVVKNTPVQERRLEKSEPVSVSETTTANKDPGYFKTSFEQQVKIYPAAINSTVTSGIFKTTSGWQDAKYYMLMDKVATGTIVRVINPGNNKVIFAKVLGGMNGIRQNDGYDIRISNAAAATLGVTETDKFILKVNY
ncbi:LysM peptidoglycan-binding domain-containing protein [Terrimonas pollutisoli]|uniref:LysM peptidoglycan-binding domain-containing protein n=1 Tax=Terrimonas pollutisoli TaxID=3034147 RepID=UPI0023EB87A7|nr:LysM peptidoglycan-binding domain-containing protein [Terrimonas sp. H1YJ31]